MSAKEASRKRKPTKDETDKGFTNQAEQYNEKPSAGNFTILIFIILLFSLYFAIGTFFIELNKDQNYNSEVKIPDSLQAQPLSAPMVKQASVPVAKEDIKAHTESISIEKTIPKNEAKAKGNPKQTDKMVEPKLNAVDTDHDQVTDKIKLNIEKQKKLEETNSKQQNTPVVSPAQKEVKPEDAQKEVVKQEVTPESQPSEPKSRKNSESQKEQNLENNMPIRSEPDNTQQKAMKSKTDVKPTSEMKQTESRDMETENIQGTMPKQRRHETPPTEQEKAHLLAMYIEVEALADNILEEDPKNELIKQLTPHFESTLRDIENGKIAGINEGLLHIKTLLQDLRARLDEAQKDGKTEALKPKDETLSKDGKQPVEEVIPDPVYIAPREAVLPQEQLPEDTRRMHTIQELELAEDKIEKNPKEALSLFKEYIEHHPNSAYAMYGQAKALDKLSEIEKSNSRLEQAIYAYRSILELATKDRSLVPDHLLREAGLTCSSRMAFRGLQGKAVRVLQNLLEFFPDDAKIQNQLGVSFLMMNEPKAAQKVFKQVLDTSPDDGFAQAHYGFALKTEEQNYDDAIKYLRKGIESGAEGTVDGRFYLQLGDAYQRTGQSEKAYQMYDEGVEKGLFLNRYQRSLYNIDRLKSQPLWTLDETTYQVFFRKLENNWQKIKEEGMQALSLDGKTGFQPETENLKQSGDWKQFELFARGRQNAANCARTPFTCSLINDFPAAARCKRGQVKFSVMQPHTHVWPHTGPTNCRLRSHLGLIVPEGVSLRVGEQNSTWTEGKVIVFDDSWEHEVWHTGKALRLVLIVDVWHPQITNSERKTLTAI